MVNYTTGKILSQILNESYIRLECMIEIIEQDDLRVRDEVQVFDAVYKYIFCILFKCIVDEDA